MPRSQDSIGSVRTVVFPVNLVRMDQREFETDQEVRRRAFDWLERETGDGEDVLARDRLLRGFEFQGRRVGLMSPAQGIFKPAVLSECPLSITTAPKGPYSDGFLDNHYLLYRYRGTDPNHRDNRGLRRAMELRLPLIYLFGMAPGRYLPVWPVYIVNDNPGDLSFTVAADYRDTIVDQVGRQLLEAANDDLEADIRRRYQTAAVQQRVHQRAFRERVLLAYREQCAMCRLRHRELLDASHIIPDRDERGEPVVSNGLSLCKIHHTAFDRGIVGVAPDYRVEVREDILEEVDGPMLEHGIKQLHGSALQLPRKKQDRPNRDALEWRYREFRQG